MKKLLPFLVAAFLLLAFSFCGKKGPILPPFPLVVQEVEEFEISQRGESLILEWENPTAYTDGRPLSEISVIEIWVLERANKESGEDEPETEGAAPQKQEKKAAEKKKAVPKKKRLSKEEFGKKARLLASIPHQEFSTYQVRAEEGTPGFRYEYRLQDKDFKLESLTFGLRVKTKKRRKESEFSRLLTVRPRILSLPPQAVEVRVFQDRIQLRWSPPEKNIDGSSPARFKGFNVYRREGNALPERVNSRLIQNNRYNDKDFLMGTVYWYCVRASLSESSPFIESADSEIVKVKPEDIFPPAVPSGLVSIVAGEYVSLTWDENREEDLAGYRVWRKAEGEKEFIPLTPQPIKENAFNDTAVEKNTRYTYAITAQDVLGNESSRSKGVSEIVRDGWR